MDRIYTPRHFADQLAVAALVTSPFIIADFAAGDGALLIAAKGRWPSAQLFACDIDELALARLGKLHSEVEVAKVDFLDDAARAASERLSSLRGKCDLILLNPPFSCRGNVSIKTIVGNSTQHSGVALAFFVRGLEYISRDGELIAILPSSCLTSQRDRQILDKVRERFYVDPVGDVHKSVFDGHSVSVIVLRASRRKVAKRPIVVQDRIIVPETVSNFDAHIMRGTFPVHLRHQRLGPYALIHTSELQRGMIVGEKAKVCSWQRTVRGSAVFVPRVGRPDVNKVAIKNCDAEVVISDCIFSISTEPAGNEEHLQSLIIQNWRDLSRLYSGSCAPYLTAELLSGFIKDIGVRCSVIGRSRKERTENIQTQQDSGSSNKLFAAPEPPGANAAKEKAA